MSVNFDVFFGCPKCHKKVNSTFQKIQNHELLKCPSCDSQFTIHDVYDFYYANDPLVKGAIDLLTRFSGEYGIKPTDDNSHKSIEKFLQDSKFNYLLKEAFKHIFLYGDAYILLKKDKSNQITGLQLLHPRNVSIELGEDIQRGQAFTGEKEIKRFRVDDDGTIINFPKEDIIHLKGHDVWLYDTYGESIIRIVLPQLYNVRFARAIGSVPLINMLENSIIPAFGIPKSMIEKKLNKDVARLAVSLFTNDIDIQHRHVRNKLQTMINKIAIAMKLKTTPQIELRKPNNGIVLAHCGYDMTEDIEMLKKLVDNKIISPTEFENITNQWLGKV